MEKLFLLHEKFLTGCRAEGDAGERQSRHLYDLVQMINKGAIPAKRSKAGFKESPAARIG